MEEKRWVKHPKEVKIPKTNQRYPKFSDGNRVDLSILKQHFDKPQIYGDRHRLNKENVAEQVGRSSSDLKHYHAHSEQRQWHKSYCQVLDPVDGIVCMVAQDTATGVGINRGSVSIGTFAARKPSSMELTASVVLNRVSFTGQAVVACIHQAGIGTGTYSQSVRLTVVGHAVTLEHHGLKGANHIRDSSFHRVCEPATVVL
jgi:hypothetical protein